MELDVFMGVVVAEVVDREVNKVVEEVNNKLVKAFNEGLVKVYIYNIKQRIANAVTITLYSKVTM